MDDEVRQFLTQFKLVCKKCGSENCVIDFTLAKYYSEETGWDPATLSAGCNSCEQNDFYASF